MSFAVADIEQISLHTREELHRWIRSNSDISRIPVEGLLIDQARFHDDRSFGTIRHRFGFNLHGFRAFCSHLGLSPETLFRLEEEGLASRVLNDLLEEGRFQQAQRNIDFIVRDSDRLILGIVSKSYQTYPNSRFLEDLEAAIGQGRNEEMAFHSGFVVNTQVFVRFLSERRMGIIQGRGGEGDDITRIGLQCRNSMVGESSVVWEFFLHRLACANGAVVPAGRNVQKLIHTGRADTFRDRLQQRLQACLRKIGDVEALIRDLGDIPFIPEKLAGTPGAQMALEVIPDARYRIIDRIGRPEIKDPDESQRRRGRDAAYLRLIPDVVLGSDSRSVFKSPFRDNASMFDLINVFTEHARGIAPERRMGVEERAGALAAWIVDHRQEIA